MENQGQYNHKSVHELLSLSKSNKIEFRKNRKQIAFPFWKKRVKATSSLSSGEKRKKMSDGHD